MRSRKSPRTPAQLQHTSRWLAASAAWSQQGPAIRALWNRKAEAFKTLGYRLWLREWFKQDIAPESIPHLPEGETP
ncbi:hypothetical protein CCP4SC76_3620003 [Gammaproteobacteria bacterium]